MKKIIHYLLTPLLIMTLGFSINAQMVHHKSFDMLGDAYGTAIDHAPMQGYIQTTIFKPGAVNNGTVPNSLNLDRGALLINDMDLNLIQTKEFVDVSEQGQTKYQIKLYDVKEITDAAGGYIVAGGIFDHTNPVVFPRGLLIRLDPALNVIWAHTYLYEGEFQAVAFASQSADQGFIAAGYEIDIASGLKKARLTRVNNMGQVIWESEPTVAAGNNTESIYMDVVEGPNHHYYATGSCGQIMNGPTLLASEVLVTAVDESFSVSMPPHNTQCIVRPNSGNQVSAEVGEAIDIDIQGNLVVVGRTYYDNLTTPIPFDADALVISLNPFTLSVNWANEYTMLGPNHTMENATSVDIDNFSIINVAGNMDDVSFFMSLDMLGNVTNHRLFNNFPINQTNDFKKSADGYAMTGAIHNFGGGAIEDVYSYEYEYGPYDLCSNLADPSVVGATLDPVSNNTNYMYTGWDVQNLYTVPMYPIQMDVCSSDTMPPLPPCEWVNINTEDFESGWGIWNDGGLDCRRHINDAPFANSGSYCARLRGNSVTSTFSTNVLDLSSYSDIQVNFSYYVLSFDDPTEDFWLQISLDGGTTFSTVEEWNLGDEFLNDERKAASIDIAGPFTSTTVLRFRCDASPGAGDFVFIDDIEINRCHTFPPCSEANITNNDFELNWGIWNDGGLDCRRHINDTPFAHSGFYTVRLRGNSATSNTTSNTLDLTNYADIEVSFSYITHSFDDPTEDFWLQISSDGGTTFTTVEEWNLGDEFLNSQRKFESIHIMGPFTSTTVFRFRCDASPGAGDYVYIDDIDIYGCNTIPPCNLSNISTSDFESGWDIWNDGGLECRRHINDAPFANSGSYCVRLRGNSATSNTTSDVLDLTGYSDIEINFSYLARSFDSSTEDFWLQLSTDGGVTFSTIEEWNLGDEFINKERKFESIHLVGPFTSTTVLRFRCDATVGAGDYIFIDDIEINGCLNTSSRIVSINDKDGHFLQEYQAIESLLKTNEDELTSLNKVYPNPAQSAINIEFNTISESEIMISIYDIAGKLVKQVAIGHVRGQQLETIDIAALNSGYYILVLKSGYERITKKFTKL